MELARHEGVHQTKGTACVTTLSRKRSETEASMLKFVSEGENDGTKNRKREIEF